MDLKSPTTLLAAWVLVPVLATLVAAGLGVGLRLASGVPLRALTVPAGYLAGVAIVGFALEAGLSGSTAVALCVGLALAGPLAWAVLNRERLGGLLPRPAWPPPAWAFAALAGLAAYAVALAPVAGSGRSAVLGYVLNNDSIFHISLVELLSQHGAQPVDVGADSFHTTSTAFSSGYPLGSYAWPLVGHALSGVPAFHLWSPLIAVTVGMIALVAFDLLRDVGAGPRLAAAGGAGAAVGSLTMAYVAQGGAKEVLMPLAVLGAVALAARPFEERVTGRALLPAGLATGAAVANLGYSAAAWLGPAALAMLVWLVVRAVRSNSWCEIRSLALYGAVALPIALPGAISSLDFFRNARLEFEDPAEVGNLVGPLSWRETLNVWLAGDYRFRVADYPDLTKVGSVLALVFIALGVLQVVRRGRPAIAIAAGAALAGALLVTPRVSIYFDAKTLVILAPALGVATAAGVVWAVGRAGVVRALGVAGGLALVAGVLGSAALTYAGAWVTPRDRFDELVDIDEHFDGRGPTLVNDREYYAAYLLRNVGAWDSWGERPVDRGLRFGFPPGLPHTPDFDDYAPSHFARFPLLVDARRPGGSLPPSNYRVAYETAHYRVWERSGPDPQVHLALGLVDPERVDQPFGAGNLDGSERLDCEAPEVRQIAAEARAGGRDLLVALPGSRPRLAVPANAWVGYKPSRVPAPPGQTGKSDGGVAGRTLALEPGVRYVSWLQGSFGPGVRLFVDGQPKADVLQDLGLPSQWFAMGEFTAGERTNFQLVSLERSPLLTGSDHHELVGPLVVTRADEEPRVERVPPGELDRFCGREVDWIEIPA